MLSAVTLRLIIATAFVAVSMPAAGEPVSPWVEDSASRIRLVDAGVGPRESERLAGVEITLAEGWKTYWRQPGATGVPPRFDFSGSTNLASAEIAYPPPERSADSEGVTYVYHGGVDLPVILRPKDASAPIVLKLVADYGVCEKICVPLHATSELTLVPSSGAEGPSADETRAALARTPKQAALGASGPLGVRSVSRVSDGALEIVAAAPAGPAPVLFAEAGDGSYVAAPDLAQRREDGAVVFRMTLDEPELPASGLRFTLASSNAAIETPVSLDEIARRP